MIKKLPLLIFISMFLLGVTYSFLTAEDVESELKKYKKWVIGTWVLKTYILGGEDQSLDRFHVFKITFYKNNKCKTDIRYKEDSFLNQVWGKSACRWNFYVDEESGDDEIGLIYSNIKAEENKWGGGRIEMKNKNSLKIYRNEDEDYEAEIFQRKR